MADKIRGITIEFNADASQVSKALGDINSQASLTQKQLTDVNRLLKLDPGNTELLAQKQQLLGQQITNTKTKIESLKQAEAQLKSTGVDENSQQMMALRREIEASKIQMQKLEKESKDTDQAIKGISKDGKAVLSNNKENLKVNKENSNETAKMGANFASYAALIGVAVKSAQALFSNLQESAAFADDIATTSIITGISTKELQELEYMAGLIDTDVSTIQTGLKKIIQAINQVESGTGEAEDYFDELGVNIYDANGTLRKTTDIFWDTIYALGEMEDATERELAAYNLLGKSAMELNPLIAVGREEMEMFRKEADKTYVLNEEEIDRLNEVQDSLDRLTKSMEALKNTISLLVAESGLAEFLQDITTEVNNVNRAIKQAKASEDGLKDYTDARINEMRVNPNDPVNKFGNWARGIGESIGNFFKYDVLGAIVPQWNTQTPGTEGYEYKYPQKVQVEVSVDDSSLAKDLRIKIADEDNMEGGSLVR